MTKKAKLKVNETASALMAGVLSLNVYWYPPAFRYKSSRHAWRFDNLVSNGLWFCIGIYLESYLYAARLETVIFFVKPVTSNLSARRPFLARPQSRVKQITLWEETYLAKPFTTQNQTHGSVRLPLKRAFDGKLPEAA